MSSILSEKVNVQVIPWSPEDTKLTASQYLCVSITWKLMDRKLKYIVSF